jgi:hypothetical protein
MKASEFKKLIREEIRKALKESVKTTNPEIIRQNHEDMLDGFYVFKGGSSFGKGPSSYMGGNEYSQFDPDKAKPILYSPNEADIEKYKKDGYVIVSNIDGESDIAEY